MSAAAFDARAQRNSPDSHQFNYAMAASIALHMALLFSFSMRPAKSPQVPPGPIVARLAPAAAVAPVPAAPQPEPPKPRSEEAPTPPQVKPIAPKPAPAPKAAPAPQAKAKAAPQAPVPPAPAEPAASPPTAPTAAAPSPAQGAPVAKAEPAPTAPAAPPADAGTLDTYRMDLLRMARNYKRYPRVAMDNNWEGRVVVRMVIGANGLISSIAVTTTSGHEILDKQAVDMIQKAKPRVQIPAALRGKEFPIEIPVIYSLKDAG